MRQRLDELVKAYLALAPLLECRFLSSSARSQLEDFRDELEREIGVLQNSLRKMSANWPSYRT
jgi:hypothetical protein